jgi:hypothetical protein
MAKAAASVEKVDGDLMKGEEEMKLKELSRKIREAKYNGRLSDYHLTAVKMNSVS